MNKKQHYFLISIPRSGSTIFSAILSQNLDIYVTPTTFTSTLISNVENAWKSHFVVQSNNYIEDQLNNVLSAIFNSFWQHRSESIIIHNDREWAHKLNQLQRILKDPIKVIFLDRDLPSIMTSWIDISNKNPNNEYFERVKNKKISTNIDNLSAQFWFDVVKRYAEGKKKLYDSLKPSQILTINYDDLINNPTEQLLKFEEFLNLSHWEYQFENITSDTIYDDETFFNGLKGLHTIRPKLEKTSKNPKEILGESLYDKFIQLDKKYK